MSTTRWIIIVLIIAAATIYWIWETERGKKSALNIDPNASIATGDASEVAPPATGPEDFVSIEQIQSLGIEAANRTKKYAGLFETIGAIFQALNLVGGSLLAVIILFIPANASVKLISILGVLILMGLAYVQTSLIRGLASYFQMKANDHIIRNWKK